MVLPLTCGAMLPASFPMVTLVTVGATEETKLMVYTVCAAPNEIVMVIGDFAMRVLPSTPSPGVPPCDARIDNA